MGPIAFQASIAARDSQELRPGGTGRNADGSNPFWIHAMPIRASPQESNRAFHIVQWKGKLKHGCQPVTDRGRDIAVLRQSNRHRQVTLSLATTEAPAVNHDDGRILTGCFGAHNVHG